MEIDTMVLNRQLHCHKSPAMQLKIDRHWTQGYLQRLPAYRHTDKYPGLVMIMFGSKLADGVSQNLFSEVTNVRLLIFYQSVSKLYPLYAKDTESS